jgi:hypothetical protein
MVRLPGSGLPMSLLFGTAGRVGGGARPEDAWYMACVAVVVIPGGIRQLEVSLGPRGDGG